LGAVIEAWGPNSLYTTSPIPVSIYGLGTADGLSVTSTQNFWWDFAQTGVFTG